MPQRTNDYQKLLLYINDALAPSKATITESAMLWDKASEKNREVDILIEDSSGPYKLKIGIECSDRSRKLDLNIVEQLHQKHKNLNIGKTVIISSQGFTESALRYGSSNEIELLTFNAALEKEWPSWFEKFQHMSLIHSSFTCTGAYFTFLNPIDEGFLISKNIMVESPVFGRKLVHDFIYLKFSSDRPSSIKSDGEKNMIWTFDPPLNVVDENNIQAKVVEINFSYNLTGVEIPMQYGELNKSSFSYGIATEGHPYKRIAVIASPSGELTESGDAKANITVHIDTEE